jgi:uncharacterized protein (DUF488 family)
MDQSANMSHPSVVFTVGHSTHPLEEFTALLQEHQITLLADVRKMPMSRRNPQFNSDALAAALKNVRIGYIHIPELGGLRRRHADSPNTGWKNPSFRAYADYMLTDEFAAGLEGFLRRARRRRACLMCAEAVPWRCHRSLIADALVVRGVRVEHILSRGKTYTHKLKPWARVEGTRITYPPVEV